MVETLSSTDHGIVIRPSIKSEVGDSCQNVDLVLPASVTCESDLVPLADLVRRYLRGDQNVLEGYAEYKFADWMADHQPYFRLKINDKEKN